MKLNFFILFAVCMLGVFVPLACSQSKDTVKNRVALKNVLQSQGNSFSDNEGMRLPKKGHDFLGSMISGMRRPVDCNSRLYRFSSDFFAHCKEYSVKVQASAVHDINPIITLEEFNNVLDQFIKLYSKNPNFLDKKNWIEDQSPQPGLLEKVSADLNFRHPYAQRLDLEPNNHIAIFGDIHGSCHSFLRSIWKRVVKGFLDENLHITDPKGYIVLLGDLVDRGRYSVEVLYLAMLLKLANPDRVYILRGNHEDPKMGSNGGLYTVRDEILDKYNNQPDLSRVVINKLNCFYDLLPFIMFVGCNKNYKIFSHAGIDLSYNCTKLLSSPEVTYECLKGKQENSEFLDMATRDRAIEHFNRLEHMPVGKATDFYCVGFNWCDFARYKNSRNEVLYSKDKITFSGHGYNISCEVFAKIISSWNNELAKFGIKISGLVRGHQHTSFGLMLLDPTIQVQDGQVSNWLNLLNIEDIQSPKGFSMDKVTPIFTLMSAPEGVGQDDAHGMHVEFNKDSMCMITTGSTDQDWFIKPIESTIPVRSTDGIYCALTDSQDVDHIEPTYTEQPVPRAVTLIQRQQQYAEMTDMDYEVEEIFSKIKQQLHIDEQLGTHDIQPQQNSLQYPIDSSIKTPSLNHIRWHNKSDELDQESIRKLLRSTHQENYLSLVEKALSQEINHNDDYYVFYHAHRGKFAFSHDIYKLFYSWGFLRKDQPLPLRFVNFDKIISLEDFLQQTDSMVKNNTGVYEYVDEFGNHQTRYWFDHIPEFRQQLLSTNCVLLGNHKLLGESTLGFLAQNHSENGCDLEDILRTIFVKLHLPEYFLDKIMQASKQYASIDAQCGKLLQIFVKKDVVDHAAYWACAGGKPINQKIIDACWNPTLQRHTSIKPLLDMYQNNPQELNKLLGTYQHQGYSHVYNLDLDSVQARLYLLCPDLYNPEKTTIFRYGSDPKNYINYLAKLNAIFEEMIRYFIRQKLSGQTLAYQFQHTPLKYLDTLVSDYKMQKNIQKTSRHIDYYNVDSSCKTDVLYAEDKFVILAKQIFKDNKISPEIAQELKEILPLCKRLPGQQTPLMYAVEMGNTLLAKFLIDAAQTNNIELMPYNVLVHLAKITDDPTLLSLIMKALVQHDNELGVCDLAECIIKKQGDEKILVWGIQLAEKIAKKNPLIAAKLVKSIMEKDSGIVPLDWYVESAHKLVKLNVDVSVNFFHLIIKKYSGKVPENWPAKVADSLAASNDVFAASLAHSIIEKQPEATMESLYEWVKVTLQKSQNNANETIIRSILKRPFPKTSAETDFLKFLYTFVQDQLLASKDSNFKQSIMNQILEKQMPTTSQEKELMFILYKAIKDTLPTCLDAWKYSQFIRDLLKKEMPVTAEGKELMLLVYQGVQSTLPLLNNADAEDVIEDIVNKELPATHEELKLMYPLYQALQLRLPQLPYRLTFQVLKSLLKKNVSGRHEKETSMQFLNQVIEHIVNTIKTDLSSQNWGDHNKIFLINNILELPITPLNGSLYQAISDKITPLIRSLYQAIADTLPTVRLHYEKLTLISKILKEPISSSPEYNELMKILYTGIQQTLASSHSQDIVKYILEKPFPKMPEEKEAMKILYTGIQNVLKNLQEEPFKFYYIIKAIFEKPYSVVPEEHALMQMLYKNIQDVLSKPQDDIHVRDLGFLILEKPYPTRPEEKELIQPLYAWLQGALLTLQDDRAKKEVIEYILEKPLPLTPQEKELMKAFYQTIVKMLPTFTSHSTARNLAWTIFRNKQQRKDLLTQEEWNSIGKLKAC